MCADSQKAIAKTRMILHEVSERSGFLFSMLPVAA
jgi:hypothetical protein